MLNLSGSAATGFLSWVLVGSFSFACLLKAKSKIKPKGLITAL